MKCTNCGFDVPLGFRFCGNCGAKLSPQCPACGAEVPEDFKFCGQCGAPLQAPGPPPAAAPPQPAMPTAPESVLLQEELKQVTILFGDLSGFTAMSEKLQPEEVRLIMDACLKQLAKEVERFGGTVDKFSGDNIMALFGAPVAHEDDPERAVMAAISMQEALKGFSADLEKRTGLRLQMRMGINTGPVVAGITGSERAKDYTVLGDAVNLASRLEQAAEKGKILVGEGTQKATRAVIDYRELAPVTVKGKSQPVPIWEVVGPKARPEARRGIRGLEAPLVGRDEELARLKDAFQRTVERKRPQMVTILGSPGLGKSRLAAEFERDLASLAPSAAVRRGQCVPYGSTTAFQPLAEAVKSECGILDNDPPPVAAEKLMLALQSPPPLEGLPDGAKAGRDGAGQLLERVSFALGLASGDHFSAMDPKNVKEEIFWGLRKFLEKRAALHPLVLLFDDVQWADPSLLEFLEYLAERCEAVPLLVLALSRPDLMDKHPTWGAYKKNYISIFLEPLDQEKSFQLIREMLRVEQLPERLRGIIVAKAEGNPFYVEEILRMLIEDGVLVQEEGAWQSTADLMEGRLPDSIQALVSARIDRLQVEEKRVLQEASAVGGLFWEGILLRLAADLDQEALERSLRSLEIKELLVEHDDSQLPGEREWAFNHILVRDVAYESVPRARRAGKHTQAARWIEEKATGRIEAFVEMLAYHWEQAALVDLEMGALLGKTEESAENRRRAAHYLKLAGDKAKSMQSNQEANGFYNRAMTIMNSLLQEDDTGEGEDLQLALLCSHAEVLEGLGEYNRAIEQMEMVQRKAGQRGLRGLEGGALRLLGSLHRDKGDLTEAERLARLALACLAGEDQLGARGETLLLMGKIFHDLGQPGESRRWAEEALKLAQELADRRLELATLPLLGTLNLHRGQLDQAEELYQQATSLARDIGDKRLEGSTLYSLGNVDLNQGDLAASREHLTEAIGAFREMANRRGEAWSLLTLGTTAARGGDTEEGRRLVGQALRICQETGDKWGEPWCLRALGEFALAERDLVQAEKDYEEALSKTHNTGDRGILPELYRGLAEVSLARGQAAQTLEYADLAREAVSEDDAYSQGTTWRVRGMALAAMGREEEAEDCLKRSVAVLEKTGFRPELARSYREYAHYLERAGKGEEAIALIRRAEGLT